MFTCVRKLKEDADALRGTRSLFKTDEFAGLLKNVFDEEEGKFDWAKLGRRVQHCGKGQHHLNMFLDHLNGLHQRMGHRARPQNPLKEDLQSTKPKLYLQNFQFKLERQKKKIR